MLVIREKEPVLNVLRKFTNKPEIRFHNILSKIKPKYQVVENHIIMDTVMLKKLGVHNEQMIDFLSNCFESYEKYLLSLETIGTPIDETFGSIINGLVPYNISTNQISVQFFNKIIKKMEYFRQIGLWSSDFITPIFSNIAKKQNFVFCVI